MSSESSPPTDLGRLATLEPLALEPGMIVWDRFCVVGQVRHDGAIWSVPVTDLARELGHPPHHRLTIAYLAVDEDECARVRRAVQADEQVQPRVRATIDLGRGLALVHDPVAGEHVGAELPGEAARVLALDLAGLLVRLHEAEVYGIDLRSRNLRQREGQFRLDGFEHLSGTGTAVHDLDGALTLLRRVAGDHLRTLFDPRPDTAARLWTRARALARDRAGPSSPLRQHPPFIGREAPLRALERAFADAEIARSSVTLVSAGQGLGKTRLLDEWAERLRDQDRALVIRGEYLRGCGESRAGLLGALAELPQALARSSQESTERVRERLRRRIGASTQALLGYAPALAELLGDPQPVDPRPAKPDLTVDAGFGHHAVAVADAIRCIGSQARPLVILLDNLQLADLGSIALIRRLLIEDRSHHTMIVAGLCGPAPFGLATACDEGSWNPQRDPQLLLRRINLEPWTASELERLLVEGLPGPVDDPSELAAALLETSRGNPLVAWATLHSWIDGGALTRTEADPWVLRKRKLHASSPSEVFGERVDRASLDERWLALLAALAGGHVDEAWLRRVAGWEPARISAAVEGLERHGLLGKAGEASLRFPHERVRELVVERSAAADLRRAHTQIADWLASLGPRVSAARLAYHTDSALGHHSESDLRLAEMHLAAGREMLGVFDLERSSWHFNRALHEHRAPSGGRIAAIEGAADVALLADKCDDAAQLYAEAVAEAEDPLLSTRIAAKAVHGLYRKSAAREAQRLGRLALARAGQPLPEPDQRVRVRVATLRTKLGPRLRRTLGKPPEPPLREQLCWLYARMAMILALSEPEIAELCLARARIHGERLDSAAAATVHALHGARAAVRGDLDEANLELARAVELGERLASDWAVGFADHLRGQHLELAHGDYARGVTSLDRAAARLRRTGDLSIAVSSLLIKAIYGRDREPIHVVHTWLDEAAALNEIQADSILDLPIEALRLLLRARAGARNVVEAAAALAVRASSRRLIGFEAYLVSAYLALALLEVGEQPRARAQIDVMLARIAALGPAAENEPEYTCELWAAVAVTLLAGPSSSAADRERLADAIRRLELAGRRSPRAAALTGWVSMRQALDDGHSARARRAAEALIADLGHHGQVQLAIEAHRTLGELLRGAEVLAAREHLQLASELAAQLGHDRARESERERERAAEQLDVPRGRTRERSSRRQSNAYLRALARNETVELGELLERSRQVLLDTVGEVAWIYLRSDPQLRLYAEAGELQALLVHLVLCGRDSVVEPEQLRVVATLEDLDEIQAAAIPGASPGRWGKIAVTVVGPGLVVGVTGGVTACRQAATRLGGFLELECADELLTLAVRLPPADTGADRSGGSRPSAREHRGPAYVIHPDPRIRETLTSAITRFGLACIGASPREIDLAELPTVTVLFVDGETLRDCGRELSRELDPTARIVELVIRGDRRSGTHPALRVPFALGELHGLLELPDPKPDSKPDPNR